MVEINIQNVLFLSRIYVFSSVAGIRSEWPGFGYWWEQGFIVCHHVHVGSEPHSSPCAVGSCGYLAKDEVALSFS